MLFDEITAALDPALTGEVLKVLEQVAREDMTMKLVTRAISFAPRVATRLIFMHEGRIREKGRASEVLVLAKPRSRELETFFDAVLH